jgi:hypothetical protein
LNFCLRFRSDTALDCINAIISRRFKNSPEDVRRDMIGAIVVTKYNNDKTYRIDDVRFDINPRCK